MQRVMLLLRGVPLLTRLQSQPPLPPPLPPPRLQLLPLLLLPLLRRARRARVVPLPRRALLAKQRQLAKQRVLPPPKLRAVLRRQRVAAVSARLSSAVGSCTGIEELLDDSVAEIQLLVFLRSMVYV